MIGKVYKEGRRAHGLERVAPLQAREIGRCLRVLEGTADRLRPEQTGLAHGAFRHNQVLLRRGRLVVLDLDTLRVSGVSADAGELLGYLDRTALARPRLGAVIDECEDVFLSALADDPGIRAEWLAWHRAAAHVKFALRSFYTLAPGWPDRIGGLVRLARRTLASAEPGARV
jgi:hypothetical protein